MDEFLDSHPLPAKIKEVDCQSNGKNLHFLHSIDPTNIKKGGLTHWTTLSVFVCLSLSSDLDTIEKELMCSAKKHHSVKKNRYIMNLLRQTTESEISSYEDSQPSSLECTITSQ